MRRMVGACCAGLLIALLGACAMQSRAPAPVTVSTLMGTLPARWHAVGRVAVKHAGEGWTAGFDWRQLDERADINLRGPLGIGAVMIALTPDHLRIESNQQPVLELDAPFDAMDSVLQQRLGFVVPLAMLRYWILGVPDPTAPSVRSVGGFEQQEWQVSATEGVEVLGAAGTLPARLEIRHGDTRVRWVIDQWHIGAP